MPRPSLKAERTEEILDAFERCILRDGIANTSLEQIAAEAKMKRSILRHYIGNRDQIILALYQRWHHQNQLLWQTLLNYLPEENRNEALIDMLFGERDPGYTDLIMIGEALFSEARRIPKLRDRFEIWLDEFIAQLGQELQKGKPSAGEESCQHVAAGILSIYLLDESLIPIGLSAKYQHTLAVAAKKLLRTL